MIFRHVLKPETSKRNEQNETSKTNETTETTKTKQPQRNDQNETGKTEKKMPIANVYNFTSLSILFAFTITSNCKQTVVISTILLAIIMKNNMCRLSSCHILWEVKADLPLKYGLNFDPYY